MTKLAIIKMITYYSLIYGIDLNVAISVAAVESQFNPNVIGITGDYGVFQLQPASFPNYTKEQLLNPQINIELGIKYLAKVKKECNHKNNNEWLICFNIGLKGAKKVKHPELFPYVKKINVVLNEIY